MTLGPDTLELSLAESGYGLSACRLWEHTELGQINVFSQAISSLRELNVAAVFIDVVWFTGDAYTLAGFTLAELKAGRLPEDTNVEDLSELLGLAQTHDAVAFVRTVADHVDQCSMRRAMRNLHPPFLPPARKDDPFGVPLLFSTLKRRLQSMGNSKSGAEQWCKSIDNFQKKGLRSDELERSNLMPQLAALDDTGNQAAAAELANLCNFKELRLSVIPVVNDAHQQLRFANPSSRKLTRIKNLPKALAGLPRAMSRFDPVLGYRIEQVEHQTLWGPEHNWQAVTYGGKMLRNASKQSAFQTVEAAAALAASHAKQNFPKRVSLGRFGAYAWTGGEAYREWLITLPYYPASYLSGHFKIRNVLAHVRCDIREGSDGERVLMLQEVQSDWAQDARRAISFGDMEPGDDERPPFLKEWPALAMKLVLLHATHQGLDAVAWTRGAHQAFRYKGLGATGLTELYDRILPREVNRMMKSYGGKCETLGVFVPTNFSIMQTENGYEVYSPERELLGRAPTLEDARAFVPDEGHELLYEVHGVRLPGAVRAAIMSRGFPAWG